MTRKWANRVLQRLARSNETFVFPKKRLASYFDESEDPYLALYERAARAAYPGRSRNLNNFAKQRRFHVVHQMINRVLDRNVVGDAAECGCRHGHSTYIIADALNRKGPRDLWVFDSFEGGLSDKVEQDRQARGDTSPRETRIQKEHFASSYEHVQSVFADKPFVRLVRGWIPDTFTGECAERKFAFAHVDVDLYEPTLGSLQFFYPRMSPGAVIVVDDYGSATYPGAKIAVDEFLADHEVSFFLENHLMGCVIVK
jgi:hypothetical protein